MTAPYGDEFVIALANGNTIRTDTYDDNPAGASYVRVCAADGSETAYWVYDEWKDDPQLVMGAFLAAAGNLPDTANNTWTFCGHWEEDEIVIDYVLPAGQQDQREDVGAYEQGLWAAPGSGATQEDAQLGVTAEYEYEHVAWDDRPAYLVNHFGGAPALFEWAGRNLVDLKSTYDLTDEQFDALKATAEAEKPGSTTND